MQSEASYRHSGPPTHSCGLHRYSVEAQFTTRGTTVQKTEFDYVVALLAHEFPAEVRDLILTPLATNLYDTLMEQLIKQTAASEQ